ncbi:phage baseplate assembly protein V [Chitinibacter sp. ZOR0017]|uniref:phage baseplate assembly protein V n=1 Tax=Chitinibacter sp. ZOR0017 TaxID=1339254 RepID=UPI000648B7FB|nr:phage baseplate assembly protein V [Chitinibacter sp. ZOR0017]
MWTQIDQRIKRALNGIRLAFRGRVTTVKNTGPVQLVSGQGLAGEPILDAELFQQFGLCTVPPEGSMLIALPVGGKSSHSIIVATEHGNYRLKILKSGEAALYSQDGAYVAVRRGRVVESVCDDFIVTAKNSVQFKTPKVETTGLINAALDITDKVGSGGKSMAAMRSSYNDHDHRENNQAGGNTSKPNQQV